MSCDETNFIMLKIVGTYWNRSKLDDDAEFVLRNDEWRFEMLGILSMLSNWKTLIIANGY